MVSLAISIQLQVSEGAQLERYSKSEHCNDAAKDVPVGRLLEPFAVTLGDEERSLRSSGDDPVTVTPSE
jgi:hypothetical protein